MPPQTIQLIIWAIQEAITLSPELYTEFSALFSKSNPTDQDWADLAARVNAKSYANYDSGLATAPGAPAAQASTTSSTSTASAALPADHKVLGQDLQPVAPANVVSMPTPAAAQPVSAPAPVAAAAPDQPTVTPAAAPAAQASSAATTSTTDAPAPALPRTEADLRAAIAAADPAELKFLYQSGGLIQDLVNQRWANANAAKAS